MSVCVYQINWDNLVITEWETGEVQKADGQKAQVEIVSQDKQNTLKGCLRKERGLI